jgi:hypothetical protein
LLKILELNSISPIKNQAPPTATCTRGWRMCWRGGGAPRITLTTTTRFVVLMSRLWFEWLVVELWLFRSSLHQPFKTTKYRTS